MSNATETKFAPQEVAYRNPGKDWVRRICKTERELDRLLARCEEKCAEVLVRDAEVSR